MKITAEEFDRRFDAGEDIDEFVDWQKAKIVNPAICRVQVNVPVGLVKSLDKEASRLKLSREQLIESWINGHLKAV